MIEVVPAVGAVPCVNSRYPALEPPTPAEIEPARDMFPELSSVEVADGVCSVVVPPPVTSAVEVSEPEETTVTVPEPPPPPSPWSAHVFVD